MRINSDLTDLFQGVAEGNLDERELKIDPGTAVTVMVVAGGYPGNYEKGKSISGLDSVEGSVVFHAGTKESGDQVVSNGGRVLAISSLDKNMEEALKTSYRNAGKIFFDGLYYRKDLGFDLR
jgi:phosphoribosylamine--glycine ligase